MTQQNPPTRTEVVQQLRETGEDALRRLKAMDAASFEEGRYENGWNGRQILAHIASIEWSYPRLIEVARAASSPPIPAPAAEKPPSQPSGGINDYNARQVEKRADATVNQLIDEFETNRQATISAFEGADEALFNVPIRSAGGVQGPLGTVLQYIAMQHVTQHINDIAG